MSGSQRREDEHGRIWNKSSTVMYVQRSNDFVFVDLPQIPCRQVDRIHHHHVPVFRGLDADGPAHSAGVRVVTQHAMRHRDGRHWNTDDRYLWLFADRLGSVQVQHLAFDHSVYRTYNDFPAEQEVWKMLRRALADGIEASARGST